MKYAYDFILEKAETLNSLNFVFNHLNFAYLSVLQFLVTSQTYAHSAKWKKLLIDWNECQENTTIIGFHFHSPKYSRESCFTLSFCYAGLYKERSTKQTTANFQRRENECETKHGVEVK